MAPIKRSRHAVDEHDSDDIVAASSSLRQEPRKKARLSGASETASKSPDHQQQRPSPASDGEDAPAPPTKARGPPPSTQYEIDRDAGFAHLDHADLDDQRATQRLLARSELIGENHAAENAIIESVTMVNFMCHERLQVTLGPLINFIVGRNGSGKSAILTAITLCLGGKASTTNRGGSLKSFIKEGRDQASLIVHLKNQGPDAYQRDLYGDTIIIERNFSKNGSSGFKLKNSSGRIVSTKKSEVDEVIEYFQMQVDNPMTVLSQDNARQFLGGSTPAIKYKFFVKGVQLEQLDNDYQLVNETAEAMFAKFEGNKMRIKRLDDNVKAAKQKLDLVQEHESLRAKLKKTARQMAWAQVEEQEQKLEQRENVVYAAQQKAQELHNDVQAKDERFQQANQAFERAAESTTQLRNDLIPLQEEESEAKGAHDSATQEMHNLHQEERQIRDVLSQARDQVQKYKQKIAEEQQRLEDINGGAHATKLTELDAARQAAANAKARLDESTVAGPHLQDAYQGALEEAQNAERPVEKKNQEVLGCESRLHGLRQDIGSTMAGYDRNMPNLLRAIRDEHRFKEKPIGPIGLHIKLLKPIWSNVLEKSFGGVLSSFIVTSKSDSNLLGDIMKRLNMFCTINIGNKYPIDTKGHEPDEQYDTILRVLDIDNELVRKQLIIGQGIEQTILIEKRTDAIRAVHEGARPRNVKQCFCLHDHRRGWGIRLGFTSNSGDPQTSAIHPPDGKPRMKTDVDSQVSYQEETLHHLKGELKTLQLRRRELQLAAQKHKQAITQHKRIEQQLNEKLERADDLVEKLQDQIDGFNVEAGLLEGLQETFREAQAEYEQHGGSYGEAGIAKERQNATCLARKRVLDDVRIRLADLDARIKKAESKSKRIQQARQIALQEKNLAIEALNDATVVTQVALRKRDEQKTFLEDFTGKATQFCVRVPVPPDETAVSLDAKLGNYTNLVKEYNRKVGGTDEEIQQRYEVAVRAHQAALNHFQGVEDLYNLLRRTYADRLQKWRQFQRYISARSRTNFTYLLSERGFRGKLLVDHQNKLLDIQVEPDLTLMSAEGRQTKTLSGGEKSFSSICLLLSVWEAMGAPLRCLDEYDVFMDNINRDVSTKMIIGAARRSVGKQFIMITPNALGGSAALEEGKDVKLIRLSAPDQSHIAPL